MAFETLSSLQNEVDQVLHAECSVWEAGHLLQLLQSAAALLDQLAASHVNNKQSYFRKQLIPISRAVYALLQKLVEVEYFRYPSSEPLTAVVQRLTASLCRTLCLESLPLDAGPLVASNIVLTSTLLHQRHLDQHNLHFIRIFKCIAQNNGKDFYDKLAFDDDSCHLLNGIKNNEETLNSDDEIQSGSKNLNALIIPGENEFSFSNSLLNVFHESSDASYPTLALAHGLLIVMPTWMQADILIKTDPINIVDLYFMLENLCECLNASYTYQAFLVLELWSTKVKSLLYNLRENEEESKYSRSIQNSMDIFSLQQNKPGRLFKFLSKNWEVSIKGVSSLSINILSNLIGIYDTIYQCQERKSSQLDQDCNQIGLKLKQLSLNHSQFHSDFEQYNSDLDELYLKHKPTKSVALKSRTEELCGAVLLLDTVVGTGLWTSRASYSSLQAILLGNHLTSQQVLERGGEALVSGLFCGLQSSHLAPSVTALYKRIIEQLPQHLWTRYFAQQFLVALTSHHRASQYNLLTLWLPPTARLYPDVCRRLLLLCPDTVQGWRAIIALLRGFKDISPAQHITSEPVTAHHSISSTHQITAIKSEDVPASNTADLTKTRVVTEGKCETLDLPKASVVSGKNVKRPHGDGRLSPSDDNDNESGSIAAANVFFKSSSFRHGAHTTNVTEREDLSIENLLTGALSHYDDFVRADALAYFCQTTKVSMFVTANDSDLIKDFFIYNINIDSSTFRQAVVKSYKSLVVRLRDTISREAKKCELIQQEEISCDSISNHLLVSAELLIWFIRFLHLQMSCNGNYQRTILSVQLYHETLRAFSTENNKRFSSKVNIDRPYADALDVIENLSVLEKFNNSDVSKRNSIDRNPLLPAITSRLNHNDNVEATTQVTKHSYLHHPIKNLMLPTTVDLLLHLLKDEMNDVRDESEEILDYINTGCWIDYCLRHQHSNQPETGKRDYKIHETDAFSRTDSASPKENVSNSTRGMCSSKESLVFPDVNDAVESSPECSVLGRLLQEGLDECRSPKSSVAEGGAVMVRVAVKALLKVNTTESSHSHDVLAKVIQQLYGKLRSDESIEFYSSSSGDRRTCSVLQLLLQSSELQFAVAQHNLLQAACQAPLYGTLLAIAAVLECPDVLNLACSCCGDTDTGTAAPATVGITCHKLASASTAPEAARSCGATTSTLTSIIDLCARLVDFVLQKMASAATANDGVAPSFAEVSKSIELIIQECEGSPALEDLDCAQYCDDANNYSDQTNSISSKHQLVLSCCWQILKGCCAVCSRILSSTPSRSSLGDESVQQALVSVLQRTLTGSRHKGAIEAAKICLSRVATVLLKGNSRAHKDMIKNMLQNVLSHELLQQQRSVTRRAAGLSMLTQSLCVAAAASQAAPQLLHSTLHTLLLHANHHAAAAAPGGGVEGDASVDCTSSVALHLLQALVQQLQHCPRIDDVATACITAFTSSCWHCRNAGLQLFGSVVVRLVGQKKVAEDTSQLNSFTAPQFCSRHPKLTRQLLRLLKLAARTLHVHRRQNLAQSQQLLVAARRNNINLQNDGKPERVQDMYNTAENMKKTMANEENVANIINSITMEIGGANDEMDSSDDLGLSEVQLSSALMPILCLLSRLSPGIQMEDHNMNKLLWSFQDVLQLMLSASIFKIRSLAAKSLISLTPSNEHCNLLHILLKNIVDTTVNTNERNGSLLAIETLIQRKLSTSNGFAEREIIAKAVGIVFTNPEECFVNRSLACGILTMLTHYSIAVDVEPDNKFYIPGYAEFLETYLLYRLKGCDHTIKDDLLLEYLGSDFLHVTIAAVTFLQEYCLVNCLADKVLSLLISTVFYEVVTSKTLLFTSILSVLFEKQENKSIAQWFDNHENVNWNSLVSLMLGDHGSSVQKNGLILFSHLSQLRNVTIPREALDLFFHQLELFVDESSNEECRLCACKCIANILLQILSSTNEEEDVRKHSIVLHCFGLLSDEDPEIRDVASTLFVRQIIPNSLVPVQPNRALVIFAEFVARHCCDANDIALLTYLWNKRFNETIYRDNERNQHKYSLYQSQTRNLYKELHILNNLLERIFFIVARHSDSLKLAFAH